MKRINVISLWTLALAMALVGCKKDEPNIENIVEDGFYVVGEATSSTSLKTNGIMSPGKNEVGQTAREGMYEKYIALEANKSFQLVLKVGSSEKKYGANLTEVDLGGLNEQPNIKVTKGKLTENGTLAVSTSGLYHIVVDLNKAGDLSEPEILIAPVSWGMRGGFNSWGYTAMTVSSFSKDSMVFTLTGQEIKSTQEFKFAYGGGWKIQLDSAGLVKANTNLGKELLPGGDNYKVSENGIYTVILKWKLSDGAISDSYSVQFIKTGDITVTYPTNMYMIGTDFGNWNWSDGGLVEMTPVNGVDGAFWCIKYFNSANGFKWCSEKAWGNDFAQLTTISGYTIADGNAKLATDGLYMVYIDIAAAKIAIEPASVYGIGDAFGGWTEAVEANKFALSGDGKTLSATTKAAGNLRMYAASSIKTTDWWTREFNIFNGKIEFRGNNGDQTAVPVTAGQTVTLDFANGTGTIQ